MLVRYNERKILNIYENEYKNFQLGPTNKNYINNVTWKFSLLRKVSRAKKRPIILYLLFMLHLLFVFDIYRKNKKKEIIRRCLFNIRVNGEEIRKKKIY